MRGGNPGEGGSRVIEQAGRASLVGSSGGVGFPLAAIVRTRVLAWWPLEILYRVVGIII